MVAVAVREAGGSGRNSRSYPTRSVFKVVLQKSTPPQIRQLMLKYQHKEQADEIEWELKYSPWRPLVRSHEERGWLFGEPTQSRISPSVF